MVKITYQRDITRLTVEGHAGFAEIGKDLVCASATILAYTLYAFVEQKERECKCWCAYGHFDSGDCIVSCIANSGYKGEITAGFDTVCRGFELLAEKFPREVSYRVK